MKQKYLHFLLCCLSITLSVFAFLCFLDIVLPHPKPETRDFDFEYDFELCSIEAYNTFVKYNIFLPHNFVTADMLSFLGEFEEVWFYDAFNLNNYRYTLKSSSGRTIYFTVYEEPWTGIEQIFESDHGKLNLNFNDYHRFRYHDASRLRHIYNGNSLYWIEWTANGVWYQISAENLHVNTTLNKLCSKNPVEQQEALDLFPDFIGDADLLAYVDITANLKTFAGRLCIFVLVAAASIVSWRFVKVKRPVWYKAGMGL